MSTKNEPFRISEPRWKRLDKGRRALEVSIEWGVLPPAWEKALKRGTMAFARALAEERIRQMEAQLDQLRADVKGGFRMLEEDQEEDR